MAPLMARVRIPIFPAVMEVVASAGNPVKTRTGATLNARGADFEHVSLKTAGQRTLPLARRVSRSCPDTLRSCQCGTRGLAVAKACRSILCCRDSRHFGLDAMSPLLDRAFTGRGFRIRLHVAPGWIVFVDVDAGSSHEGSPAVAPVPGFACRFLHPRQVATAVICAGGLFAS